MPEGAQEAALILAERSLLIRVTSGRYDVSQIATNRIVDPCLNYLGSIRASRALRGTACVLQSCSECGRRRTRRGKLDHDCSSNSVCPLPIPSVMAPDALPSELPRKDTIV